jgi:hypothetical protein
MNKCIKLSVAIAIVCCLLGCRKTTPDGPSVSQTPDDNTLLALILHEEFGDGRYTIVEPFAAVDSSLADEEFSPVQVEGYKIWPLVQRLLEKNTHPARLTLVSSRDDGYVVDYDGDHDRYFRDGGGGWEKWHEDNPAANGRTVVSLPLYDQETGYVLICMSTRSHWVAGSGYLRVYKLVDGRPKMVGQIMLWIS